MKSLKTSDWVAIVLGTSVFIAFVAFRFDWHTTTQEDVIKLVYSSALALIILIAGYVLVRQDGAGADDVGLKGQIGLLLFGLALVVITMTAVTPKTQQTIRATISPFDKYQPTPTAKIVKADKSGLTEMLVETPAATNGGTQAQMSTIIVSLRVPVTGSGSQQTVKVPTGLKGKIWYENDKGTSRADEF